MSWELRETPGGWEWAVCHTAYGAAAGCEPTRAEAMVELAIAEAAICECPYPPQAAEALRADPGRFAADYDHPGLGAKQ